MASFNTSKLDNPRLLFLFRLPFPPPMMAPLGVPPPLFFLCWMRKASLLLDLRRLLRISAQALSSSSISLSGTAASRLSRSKLLCGLSLLMTSSSSYSWTLIFSHWLSPLSATVA